MIKGIVRNCMKHSNVYLAAKFTLLVKLLIIIAYIPFTFFDSININTSLSGISPFKEYLSITYTIPIYFLFIPYVGLILCWLLAYTISFFIIYFAIGLFAYIAKMDLYKYVYSKRDLYVSIISGLVAEIFSSGLIFMNGLANIFGGM